MLRRICLNLCLVFLIHVESKAVNEEMDKLWTCPQEPVTCLPDQSPDHCRNDTGCLQGAQCCYSGCVKKCIMPDPCSRVICKEGFVCRNNETVCMEPPCQLEAVCVPDSEIACTTPVCTNGPCQAGYMRVNDSNGCPTCQCALPKKCGSTCNIFCAYGPELDKNGCPTCECKQEPRNPCSDMKCGKYQGCRLVQVMCTKSPCEPIALCVPRMTMMYENACSFTDPTTVGLPVLTSSHNSELDCYLLPCPDRTVCRTLAKNISRCCWQASQELVVEPPKVGECPEEYMIDYDNVRQTCQVDAECPGETKCCYKRNNVVSTLAYGFCMKPIHSELQNALAACQRSWYLNLILSIFGLC